MFLDFQNHQNHQNYPKLHDFNKILKKNEAPTKIKKDILTKQK